MIAEYDALSDIRGVLLGNIQSGSCGLFFTRNVVGDPMTTIYKNGEVSVDICYNYEYFEVFGLTGQQEKALTKYYELIRAEEGG